MSQFEDKIKLDNFKAQHESILGSIGVANSELEQLLLRKKEAEERVSNLDIEIAQRNKLLTDAINSREDVLRDLANKKGAIKDAEEEWAASKAANEEEIRQLNDRRSELSATIKKLGDSVEELFCKRNLFESEVGNLGSKINDLTKEVESLMKRVSELRTEADELTSKVEHVTASHNKEVERMHSEIEQLRKTRKEEADKIAEYETHVAKDKKNLERRERDVLVLTRRYHELIKQAQHVGH